ncbi:MULTISPECIES: hypothetical protein [Paraburkholderia]|uniref:hypothetical protein n=1 Tax=Paraburkholderia TaxID=1822464 RepID=UPI0022514A72|nr:MULTISPECIES: hypothetical protein [Paraburkholderia]MCX4163048.1 hypothetical protein [Paraburkholderia megapolitana]MDN7158544.1 hypothetical protein [Paraburkholderia sp. CHISQ3]MDQ6495591.1 hypothetical protein [Paraburkholderia megapolitana]
MIAGGKVAGWWSACCRLAIAVLEVWSAQCHASTYSCRQELRALIVPALRDTAFPKTDIQVELPEVTYKNADASKPLYSVQLFVPANSPENPNRELTIGWVNLDVAKLRVYDVTRNPDRPDVLSVDASRFRDFVSKCMAGANRDPSSCEKLSGFASKKGVLIPGNEAGRLVTGAGRLQFYSAPDVSCRMSGVFILEGETVDAYSEYGNFTAVGYLNAKSNGPVTGWVRSDRLKPDGVGIAPRQ